MGRNVQNRRWPWSQSQRSILILLCFGCVLLVATLPHAAANLEGETSILLDIRAAWGYPAVLRGWSRDLLTCAWYSLSCDSGNTTVISLELNSSDYSEPFPDLIVDLVHLKNLTITNWSLTGEIPSAIGRLKDLTYLSLQGNILWGQIPDEIFSLPKLTYLSLKDNCFTGPTPAKIVSFPYDVDNNCFDDNPATASCKCGGDAAIPVSPSDQAASPEESLGPGTAAAPFLSGGDLPLLGAEKDTAKRVFIVVGVVAGTLLALGTLLVTSLLIFRRRKLKTVRNDGTHYLVKHYTLDEMKDATNNFATILGAGGFAIVYHAKFEDGTEAAVKQFKTRGTSDTLGEFEKEVDLLAKIHHRFLVNLIGYCTDQGHHMLVFEFMNKGNLRDCLHGGLNSPVLTWEERVRVMISVGHGLEYLHFGRSPPLIHRDIKSANILLSSTILNPSSILADNDSLLPRGTTLIAKIADFGLGRETLLDDDEAIRAYGHEYPKPFHTKVAGTPGYIDPEYFRTSVLSSTVDVYSFGVVLLELITGKPALSDLFSGDDSWAPLAEWAMPHLENVGILQIVDPRLAEGSYDKEQLLAVAEQARLCVQSRANLRPSMRDVVGVFTESFRVETKEVYPSLHMDNGASQSADASQNGIHRRTRELVVGETTRSIENSGPVAR